MKQHTPIIFQPIEKAKIPPLNLWNYNNFLSYVFAATYSSNYYKK